ncbi:MAG: putative sulfate exporter family transporter, partial [Dehalococcoidia bacterium]|nr:putative sulfate exporter family transporter [Dehalococcoidia bacterium]
MNKTDWSSLWKKDDWWAVWVGGIILALGVFQWLPSLPVIKQWTTLAQAFPAGLNTIVPTVVLFVFLLVVTVPGIKLAGRSLKQFIPGFAVVFSLALLASWTGKYAVFSGWGLETVLWALVLGLAVSNIWRLPEWLKSGAQTEFFIKIGLVLLGAEILFSTIVKGGV